MAQGHINQSSISQIPNGESFSTSWLPKNKSQLNKFCEKHDIDKIDVSDVCDKIYSGLKEGRQSLTMAENQCTSGKQTNHLPFRIVGDLCLGTVLIFQKQVEKLLKLTNNLLEGNKIASVKDFTTVHGRKRKSQTLSSVGRKAKRLCTIETTSYSFLLNEYEIFSENESFNDFSDNIEARITQNVTHTREITLCEINSETFPTFDEFGGDQEFGAATNNELLEFFNLCNEHSEPTVTQNCAKRKIVENECTLQEQKRCRLSDEKAPSYENVFKVEQNEDVWNKAGQECAEDNSDFGEYTTITSPVLFNQNCIESHTLKTENRHEIQNVLDKTVKRVNKQKNPNIILDECIKITEEDMREQVYKYKKRPQKSLRLKLKRQLYKNKWHEPGVQLLERFNRRALTMTLNLKQKFESTRDHFQHQYIELIRVILTTDDAELGANIIYPKWLSCKEPNGRNSIITNEHVEYLNSINDNNNNNDLFSNYLNTSTNSYDNSAIQNKGDVGEMLHQYDWKPCGIMAKLLDKWRNSSEYTKIDAIEFCGAGGTPKLRALTFYCLLDLSAGCFIDITKRKSTIKMDKILLGKASRELIMQFNYNCVK